MITNSLSVAIDLVCQFVTCLMSILETKVHVHKQQVTKRVGMKGSDPVNESPEQHACSRPFTHIYLVFSDGLHTKALHIICCQWLSVSTL